MLDANSRMILSIVQLVLNIVNVVIHSVGTAALLVLYRESRHKPQRQFLISLSVCEATINLLYVVISVLTVFASRLPGGRTQLLIERVGNYLHIVVFTGLSVVYFVSMVYITLDKLAKVYLGVHYSQYWNERKTRYLLIGTWSVAVIVALGNVKSFFF